MPTTPPPAINLSGNTGSPTGLGDPDGNKTIQGSQQTTRPTNNRVIRPTSSAPANNGGSIIIEAGSYRESEVHAAQQVADNGNDVVLRQPIGKRSPTGNTSDLLVNGQGYDIYTLETSNPTRITDAIGKKADQARGVILNLSRTSVKASDLSDIQARLVGKGITDLDIKIVGE